LTVSPLFGLKCNPNNPREVNKSKTVPTKYTFVYEENLYDFCLKNVDIKNINERTTDKLRLGWSRNDTTSFLLEMNKLLS
jgi:hypothetical protein